MNETFTALTWAILAINCSLIIGVGFFFFGFGWFAIIHMVLGSLGLLIIYDKIRTPMEIKN